MPDSLDENTIKNAAESPLAAETDGTKVEGHRLPDLIVADRYVESKQAVRRAFPVKRTQMEPPGAA
jgi:hypothetical protein